MTVLLCTASRCAELHCRLARESAMVAVVMTGPQDLSAVINFTSG